MPSYASLFMTSFVLSFLSLPAVANEVCEIRGAQENLLECQTRSCSTEERTRSIKFPNGRELWIVGHNHGERSRANKLYELLIKKRVNKHELSKLMDEVLSDDSENSKQALEDLRFLKQFLRMQTELIFVAVEGDMTRTHENFALIKRTQSLINAHHNQFDDKTLAKLEKMLPSIYGPHLYLLATQSQLLQKVALVGYESEEAIQNEVQIEAKRQQALEALRLELKDNAKLLEDLNEDRSQMVLLNESYDPTVHDQMILNAVRINEDIPNNKRRAFTEWIQLEIATLNARLTRDKATSKGMSKENKSGLLFVGQLHLNAIAQLLHEECLKEMSSTEVRKVDPGFRDQSIRSNNTSY